MVVCGTSNGNLAKCFVLLLLTCLVTGCQPGSADVNESLAEQGGLTLLEPETWMSKPFPLCEHIDDGDFLRHDSWVLLIYHHGCPDCEDAADRMEQIAENPEALAIATTQWAILEMPPFESTGQERSKSSRLRRFRISNDRDWFVQTPTLLQLHQGIVTAVADATAVNAQLQQWENGENAAKSE